MMEVERTSGSEKCLAASSEVRQDALEASHDPEREGQYLTGWRLAGAIVALTASIFLVALDQGIVATAIPKITNEFDSINDVGWYGSGYLLMSTFQPLYGKLFTLLPVKPVFLMSLITFEIGSLICAVAPNSAALIVGRVIAGFGGSGVYSGLYILMAYIIPLSKRPMYAALDAIAFGVGAVAGPLLGGVFTDKLTWRWCFYINLPFGVFAAGFVWLMIKKAKAEGEPATPDGKTRSLARALFDLDSLSIFFLIAALACLLLVLQWGGLKYKWSDKKVIILLVFTAVCITTFAVIQYWVPASYTSVPRKVVCQRTVVSACLFSVGFGGSFMPIVYYLPIWFQTVKQVSALKSGIMTIPLVIAQLLSSAVSGIAVTHLGYYCPFLIIASILMAVGAGVISTLSINATAAQWIGYQLLYGIGLGLGADVPQVAIQTVLPMAHMAKATTMMILCETVGASIFISVCNNIMLQRLVVNLKGVQPSLNIDIINRVGLLNLQSTFEKTDMPAVIGAYDHALNATFKVSIALSCVCVLGSLLLEWKSVKDVEAAHSTHTQSKTSGNGTA